MPRTRINCPNCRQPIMADIEQLFDVGQDPAAKQRLLSGAVNIIQCPNCGYQGVVATPLVYHDPQKELLLTFIPPDVNVPRPEQERVIGAMINQVMNRLPQERRKAYLLRPQSVLTMQGLIERVLEADGITREMIQAQQAKLNLIQRLMGASDDVIQQAAKNEDKLMDAEFFTLLSRLIEASMAGGDQTSGQKLADLQKKLLPLTTTGKQLQEQSQEVEAAIRSLQELGRDITREKLLELFEKAPNETRVSVLTSLARPALDYDFFRLLSERIDRARGNGRERLIKLREQLLEITRQIDKQMEARAAETRQALNQILNTPDPVQALEQNLQAVDETFVQVLNQEIEAARKSGDLGRLDKLHRLADVLQKASAPPPELSLIEELLDADNDQARQKWLEAHPEAVTPEFLDMLTSLLAQSQNSEDRELVDHLQAAYRSALRYSMQANLRK